MSAPETKRVCDVLCKPIPTKKEEDKRPIRGQNILHELYANVYLCAKKKSGKTSTIYQIIKHCAGRDTVIIAFVSTLNNDDGWIGIRDYCKAHKITFIGYTSLREDGVDELSALMDHLQQKAAIDQLPPAPLPPPCARYNFGETKDTTSAPKRKTPYRAPDYMLIFDDLSDELKSASITNMLKRNRHYHFKSIISSQWLNDLPPGSLRMMDVLCLYRGHSIEKLTDIYKKARLGIPLDEFIQLYTDATSKPFGFLYMDMNEGTFRKSFTDEYVLGE
jgi:hypothetical protein